ncbi:MAG: phosphoglucosamine mutase [Candidatus Scalindua sp.]|jgi:phosphoglucosamine mutase|nr:phosphoglucosamine mutase [Candidatus Scalindua sp.]MBT5306521.1 phosphoglucosamine mutase [Candidatus Scalindua sp.]MBT6046931.1 phosphoglucosamine mutase [Candidatus Scalindua sp.]MBT6230329.1 phosphoglucosamine mutase [Candidatus Scalindua sp.]MBT6561387.1 phosphoglucosamine mutase [Candidatus Scalindua sp.]
MGKLFGTDGIRGVANVYPMVPEEVLNIGKAVAYVFKEKCGKKKPKFVIGKDTRLSGYMLENALASGIASVGADVLLVGPMPTPAIAHLTKSLNADAGIVLSASHNPAEDNGIKIFSEDGHKLPDSVEDEIEKYVLSEKVKTEHVKGDLIGKAHRVDDAKGRYIEFVKASVNSMSLKGLKIVLDCANGAAYNTAPHILKELGAEVIVLNDKPDGLNINLDCGALHPEKMMDVVKKEKADIGIALDGDADRVIVCDEKGRIVDGDHIIAICAIQMKENGTLKKNHVVVTIMANKGFDIAMEKKKIKVVKTKVGDRHVVDEMRKKGYVLGGEQSGHIIFSNYTTTGDGIISALQLLKVIKEKRAKLSKLAECMNSLPQVLVNIEVNDKKDIRRLKVYKDIKSAELKLGEKGRVLVRYSGTQKLCRIMIEGENKREIQKMANGIAKVMKKEIGA